MSSFKEWKEENVESSNNIKVISTYYNGTRFDFKRLIIKNDNTKCLFDTNTKEKTCDFLKYYMIVSYSTCKKYKINRHFLELMLYLYSEPPMTRAEFREVIKILPFRSYNVTKLVETGLFKEVTPLAEYQDSPTKFYGVSRRGMSIVEKFYLRLMKITSSVERGDKNEVFFVKPKSLLDEAYKRELIRMKDNDSDGFNYKIVRKIDVKQ